MSFVAFILNQPEKNSPCLQAGEPKLKKGSRIFEKFVKWKIQIFQKSKG